MKKVALLEFSNGHTEVLYSQTLFLKRYSYDVHLICDKSHMNRVMDYKTVDSLYYLDSDTSKYERFLKIKMYLKKENIKLLIINTASWSVIRYLPFMLWNVEIIGITHGLEKIVKSFSQKLISLKIKKYFVLSEHLYNQSVKIPNLEFSYFYASFFQDYPTIALNKKANDFWICIPGQLEYKRRDYLFLIEYLPDNLQDNIKFIILGSYNHKSGDGVDFKKHLESKNLLKNFIFFDTFIDDNKFHNYIKQSDILLPLPPSNSRYLNNAISGTFNLAYAHKKLQIMPDEYRDIPDFIDKAIFCNDENFLEILLQLITNKAIIADKEKYLNNNLQLSFDYQAQKYINFLENRL